MPFPVLVWFFLQAFLERGDQFWSLKIVKGRKSIKVAAGDAVDAGSGLYKHLREVHIVPMRLLLLLLSLSLSLSPCFKELLAAAAPRFVCGQ